MFERQLPTSNSSPKQLRTQNANLDTYETRDINQQSSASEAAVASNSVKPQQTNSPTNKANASSPFRLGLLKTPRSLKERLSKKMARLSSLDSTHTSSSAELDSGGPLDSQPPLQTQLTPLISITMSHPSNEDNDPPQQSGSQLRRQQYSDYSSRMRSFDLTSEPVDDDEDEFEDPPLPMPYSMSFGKSLSEDSSYKDARSNFQSPTYEELLDDRQGMNNSEQQFTKGEKLGRPSIDGSIVSELANALAIKKSSKGSKKDKQRRSKSPSSSSMSNANYRRSNRNSTRGGFFGLASKLKLTRKHESIAMLQLSILNSGFISLKTMDRNLQSFLPQERLSQREFEHHVKLMRRFEVLAHIEYRFASRYETYVCRHATQESNQVKNNYKRCIPYDYNRVVLKTLPNVPDSDYINASHVDSYLKPNAYIAAQGPNENTIEDFWRMIWEQKTFVIVMLTKVFDFIRVMCNQYWPVELNKPERYGNLEVTLLCEEPLADFVIRTIRLTKLRPNQAPEASNQTGADKPTIIDQEKLTESEDELRSSGSESELVATSNADERTSVLAVRAPKYRIPSHHRKHSPSSSAAHTVTSAGKLPASPILVSRPLMEREQQQQQQLYSADLKTDKLSPVRLNEFLYPTASASSPNHSSSIGNMTPVSLPGSQATPRTPSTAGLDRLSATRRAVKKKRREPRVRDARQMRTQFKAPTESQFVDDDDDDDYEDNEAELDDEGADEKQAGGELSQAQAAPGSPIDEEGGLPVKSSSTHNERIIYQFHYNSWASHTCPFINSLLHFRRRVRICMDEMSKSRKTGPTVVHCNDGCGRTGTYLCIDANLELAEEDNVYDVFNYTKKMRQSRKFLIENLEQYKFVYDTIEEAMLCNKTWFPVSELHKRLKHKSQKNPITKKNEYQREYEKITRMATKFSIGDCAGGHRVENREKNRDVSTVPPDNFRPYLTSFQSNDSTDYINAVFVDGYTRSKEYIVTEWPVHRTISDFWSLIYDHDCNSVILLANPGESFAYPSFLPSEKELRRKFGPVFSAEMVSYTHYQNIKSWIYTINKKIVSLTEVIAGVKSEAKTTQVFQITCWPQGHRVPTSTNALVELMNMVERWRQRTAYGPVCVVSLNGKSRAGVYCAANVAIEQVVQHSEVDVFQAVKTVRRHRPQLIENMTEYKYCYDLILHYVLHYVNHRPT